MIYFNNKKKYCLKFNAVRLDAKKINIDLYVGNLSPFLDTIIIENPIEHQIMLHNDDIILTADIDADELGLFSLSSLEITLTDFNAELINFIETNMMNDQLAEIQLFIDDELRFEGSIDVNTVFHDSFQNGELSLSFKPMTFKLNEADIRLNAGERYNLYMLPDAEVDADNNLLPYPLETFVRNLYKHINDLASVEFKCDWKFKLFTGYTGNFNELLIDYNIFGYYAAVNSYVSNSFTSYADILKALAFSLGATTGMTSAKKAFFFTSLNDRPAFTVTENILKNLQTKIERTPLKCIKMTDINSGEVFIEGEYTEIQGKFISLNHYKSAFKMRNKKAGDYYDWIADIQSFSFDQQNFYSMSEGLAKYYSSFYLSKKYATRYVFKLLGNHELIYTDLIFRNQRYLPLIVEQNITQFETTVTAVKKPNF